MKEKIIEVLQNFFINDNVKTIEEKYELIKEDINVIYNYFLELQEINKSITETLEFLINEKLKINEKDKRKMMKKFIKKVAKEKMKHDETSNEFYLKFKELFLTKEDK